MPNIKGFDTPNLGLQPSETGVESWAGAGRRIGAFYNQAGQDLQAMGARLGGAVKDAGDAAVAYEDHREISHGAAAGAELVSSLNDDWNNTVKKADPNDPSVAGKWREETLEPKLQKFMEGFTTQRSQDWAERFADNYRQHAFEKTAGDMSRMAGDAVKVNTERSVNAWSNAARSDPSSVQFLLDSADHSIGHVVDSSPNLKGVDAAGVKSEVLLKAKESIVKSAAMGAIEKSGDPENAWQAIAKRYPDLINGAEMEQFAKAAGTQARTNVIQQKQLAQFKQQQAESDMKEDSNRSFSDNVKFDPVTGRAQISPNLVKDALDIAKRYPDAPNAADHARTVINWAAAEQNKEAKQADDPQALRDLTDRMFDPTNPTSRIDVLKASAAGQLTPQRRTVMLDLVKELEDGPIREPVFKNAMEAAKLLTKNPTMPVNYEDFVQDFVPKYLAMKRAGTLPPNALDIKDPKSLIGQAVAPYVSPLGARLSASPWLGGGKPPNGPPPATTAPAAPERPKGFPDNAQWDASGKRWFVMQDGKKLWVNPK